MNIKKKLLLKINSKKAKIGIIGMGYVGLPLAINFAKNKFFTTGFDNDLEKIRKLKKNISYIKHVKNKSLVEVKNKFSFSEKLSDIKYLDIIIICLPTPLDKNKNPDLSYIKNTLRKMKKFLTVGKLIILESSTYPGCTRSIMSEILFKTKFKLGNNIFVGYSPEREDPNNKKYNIKNIPKICSGLTKNCSLLTSSIYKKIVNKIVSISKVEIAEFTKIYENTYRSVNIALTNELKILAYKLNIDIHEVIKAAKTKPFGFQAFYPGPGVGGHCIPIDPYYLSWVAKKNKIKTNFIFHAGKTNSKMPRWIVRESLKKNNIKKALIIGVAYKKDLDDTRESPSIDVIKILEKKKIIVDFFDPNVKYLKSRKLNKDKKSKMSLNSSMLRKYDAVYILTDHSNVDYKLIQKNSKLIIDTRNVYSKENEKKILKL
ncbi:nucleotide sugar dehydrogenase [Candidatus Pelagibacter sp.]|nr:nucleotide sugar dehydrogenase [Candidatus Pelagibacter sp.]